MKKELIEKNYQILEAHGFINQIPIYIEELSELTKELCKIQRHWKEWNGEIPFMNLNNTQLELTDTQVCLDQLKKALDYSLSRQEMDYEYKVDRELKRMKEGK